MIASMTAKPSKGGLHLVGDLIAQELINVLTKLGFITDERHMKHVLVASGTKTDKRLKAIGIRTAEHRQNLTNYLWVELGLAPKEAENALCESMRWMYGKGKSRYWDSILEGGLLYTMDDGKLRAFSLGGVKVEDVARPEWSHEVGSMFRGHRWWEMDPKDLEEGEEWQVEIALSNKKRKRD